MKALIPAADGFEGRVPPHPRPVTSRKPGDLPAFGRKLSKDIGKHSQ